MSIKKTKGADIQYGKKDKLKDSDFEPQNVGHRISIVIPEDVLMAYRKVATEKGLGYQTVMNQVLREHILIGEDESLNKRIKRLEDAVFKKRAG
jgi:predicted DNA binding CopG/RHH family protein